MDGYEIYVDKTPSNTITLGTDVTAPGQRNITSTGSTSSPSPGSSPAPSPSPTQYGRKLLALARQLEAGADRQLQLERQLRQYTARRMQEVTFIAPVTVSGNTSKVQH